MKKYIMERENGLSIIHIERKSYRTTTQTKIVDTKLS